MNKGFSTIVALIAVVVVSVIGVATYHFTRPQTVPPPTAQKERAVEDTKEVEQSAIAPDTRHEMNNVRQQTQPAGTRSEPANESNDANQPSIPFGSPIRLTATSTAWINWLIEVEHPFNAVQFEYEFLSDADGMLSVSFDGQLVYSTMERYALPGLNNTRPIWVGDVKPGKHVFSLRLDSLDKNTTVVTLTNFQTGTHLIALRGDIDLDGDVDRDDLNLVLDARGTPTKGPNDPLDLDGDGMITDFDADELRLLCTHQNCAKE